MKSGDFETHQEPDDSAVWFESGHKFNVRFGFTNVVCDLRGRLCES